MFSHIAYLNPKLEGVEMPEKGGWGVVARQPVPAGELLMVWGGNICSQAELDALPEIYRIRSVQVDEDQYLVSPKSDEPADFINHACDPNAGINGQISVVAMREINPGEEVCFDYAMTDSSPYDEFECQCGSANCRRRVTGNDWTLPELQARYKGYFSHYLQKRIERLALANDY